MSIIGVSGVFGQDIKVCVFPSQCIQKTLMIFVVYFYSTFALVLVPGLVSLLRTHAQLMLSSILLSFSPSLRFSHLATASAIPASCVSVCVPRTNTIILYAQNELFCHYEH